MEIKNRSEILKLKLDNYELYTNNIVLVSYYYQGYYLYYQGLHFITFYREKKAKNIGDNSDNIREIGIYIYIYIYVYGYRYMCIYIYIYKYMCMCVCVCGCVWVWCACINHLKHTNLLTK